MRIIDYTPDWYEALQRAVQPRRPDSALLHRPFVDYYYTEQPWCKLLLALDKNNDVVGTLGVDRMDFESELGALTLGFGSNYNSFLPGVGSFLFLRRLQECPLGLVFWSTEDTQRVIRALDWTYFHNIRRHHLNYNYPVFSNDPAWRKVAKFLLRSLPKKSLSHYSSGLGEATGAGVSVQLEQSFSAAMLPERSPFAFRFAPSVDYLNWRYNTELPFVRYRIFRVLKKQVTVGYVVLNDKPDRLTVSQCDGLDPVSLAYGVMLSIVEAGKQDQTPRRVLLTSSHPVMQRLYRRFGFRASRAEECFAVGGYKRKVMLNPDTSSWLVNFDWGNNELQTPFLGQEPYGSVSGRGDPITA